jgi:hypothetical protein
MLIVWLMCVSDEKLRCDVFRADSHNPKIEEEVKMGRG